MSHEDDREQFKKGKGGALDSLVGFRISTTTRAEPGYRAAGRLEEAAQCEAKAQAKAGTLSASEI
jgi:hypothetical protein